MIHQGNPHGIGMTRKAHEVIHNLFRVDIAAANLVKNLPDQDLPFLEAVAPSLSIRKALDILSRLTPTHLESESSMYDAVALEPLGLTLPRSQSILVPGDLRFSRDYSRTVV